MIVNPKKLKVTLESESAVILISSSHLQRSPDSSQRMVYTSTMILPPLETQDTYEARHMRKSNEHTSGGMVST